MESTDTLSDIEYSVREQLLLFTTIYVVSIENSKSINSVILGELRGSEDIHTYSHKINDRFENTYVPISEVPITRRFINQATKIANDIYGKNMRVLHTHRGKPIDGFWFNVMKSGDITGLHKHNKNAYLSSAYYLTVPEDSGNIVFREGGKEFEIKSMSGELLIFPSQLSHKVLRSNSSQERISMAMNFYTLPLVWEDESGF